MLSKKNAKNKLMILNNKSDKLKDNSLLHFLHNKELRLQ
jgi:hypothetical protein